MSGSLQQAALGYARRGMRVHPCRPRRKEPVLDEWQKAAALDVATIASWWRSRPNANIGIATGGPARVLVVDIDPYHGGEASIAAIEAEHGALPATVEAITPRGGRHLYYHVPADRPMLGNTVGKLGPGIDSRGEGGYVLAPPSTVGGRPYRWSVDSGDRIVDAPTWLLDALAAGRTPGMATAPEEWLQLATQCVSEGARNTSIAKLAGLLFRRLNDPELAGGLVACFNQVRALLGARHERPGFAHHARNQSREHDCAKTGAVAGVTTSHFPA